MSDCPGINLDERIKNLENLCLTTMTLLRATVDILKKHGIVDEAELIEKVNDLYGNLELQLLEPINKTMH